MHISRIDLAEHAFLELDARAQLVSMFATVILMITDSRWSCRIHKPTIRFNRVKFDEGGAHASLIDLG